MVFKNEAKQYIFIGLVCGPIYGLLMGLIYCSVIHGVLLGILFGVIFPLLTCIFVKIMEKKFDKMREAISKERKIYCDGGATHNGNGGWLFFTENGMEFYPHKINFNINSFTIDIKDIESVSRKKNLLIINLKESGKSVAIVVAHVKEWVEFVNDTLENWR